MTFSQKRLLRDQVTIRYKFLFIIFSNILCKKNHILKKYIVNASLRMKRFFNFMKQFS